VRNHSSSAPNPAVDSCACRVAHAVGSHPLACIRVRPLVMAPAQFSKNVPASFLAIESIGREPSCASLPPICIVVDDQSPGSTRRRVPLLFRRRRVCERVASANRGLTLGRFGDRWKSRGYGRNSYYQDRDYKVFQACSYRRNIKSPDEETACRRFMVNGKNSAVSAGLTLLLFRRGDRSTASASSPKPRELPSPRNFYAVVLTDK
jgi:hypothetical protein